MPREAPIDPALRIASVELAVSDLPRSVDFYERVLGLSPISSDDHGALLGADREQGSLVLAGLAHAAPAPRHSTGLFHVAWLHPSRGALADTVRRVLREGWRVDGASDHGVSEAVYLSDPDGLGIEIYADRPRAEWERPATGDGVKIVTLPLDLEDLLAQATHEPLATMARGSSVGHVHMKVSDVPRASAFYRDALGFEEQAQIPSAAFLSAGGYHHHIGLNSWQSQGAGPPAESAPGLRRIDFELSDPGALEALRRRLAGAGGDSLAARPARRRVAVRDPDGQLLTFRQS
jgi:catechol 2,3-dioxygenase